MPSNVEGYAGKVITLKEEKEEEKLHFSVHYKINGTFYNILLQFCFDLFNPWTRHVLTFEKASSLSVMFLQWHVHVHQRF